MVLNAKKKAALKVLSHVFAASKKRHVPPKNSGKLQIAANLYEVEFDETVLLTDQQMLQKQEQQRKEQEKKQVTLLFAHANGFHKEIWEPVLKKLTQEYHFDSWDIKLWAMDCYNSGDSAVLNEAFLPDSFSWKDYALDILSVIDEAKLQKPLIGVGHSMGGSSMIIAENLRPGTFSSVVVIDPVIFPAYINIKSGYLWANKRKDIWTNREEASKFLRPKPLYKEWNSHAFELHIEHGLRELPTGKVTLKCPRLQEHATNGPLVAGCFEMLSSIKIPVLYIAGEESTTNTQEIRELNTSKLPFGELAVVSDAGHLVVMEKPDEVALLIKRFIEQQLKDSTVNPVKHAEKMDKFMTDDTIQSGKDTENKSKL
ncbi:6512_t:CDS:2 [Ambispora leptoticha]|uniref:6512_t:CDS:1 n=1 Tax=Ambispora leptoticha TaxID=144679 RepID=A0A9N9GD73_9GLOM|nr:6512_t:CDS:2 [Ambispora leptoticha]